MGRLFKRRSRKAKAAAVSYHGVPIGGILVPIDRVRHVGIIGNTGSGKTLTLKLIMQAIVTVFCSRTLLLDYKHEFLPDLGGMGLCNRDLTEGRVVVLNAFDLRSRAWAIAKDVTDQSVAFVLSVRLIPDDKQVTQPYFARAAREIVCIVIISFQRHSPGEWTLRDLVYAVRSDDRLKAILRRDPDLNEIFELYRKPEDTYRNILSECRTRMAPFESVAAAWSHAPEQLSLNDWLTSHDVLVLGSVEPIRPAMDSIYAVLFNLVKDRVLDPVRVQSGPDPTYVLIEELGNAPKFDGLDGLMTLGRYANVMTILTLHDIDSVRAKYGDDISNVILGQCIYKAILRLGSQSAAEWVSKLVGDIEMVEDEVSNGSSSGPSGRTSSENTTHRIVRKPAILPSEFYGFEVDDEGIEGVYIVPPVGVWRGKLPLTSTLVRPAPIPNFVPRPKEQLVLRPWDAADLERLELRPDAGRIDATDGRKPGDRLNVGRIEV